jgi:hypothetical protein
MTSKTEIKEVVTKLKKQLDSLSSLAAAREKDVAVMIGKVEAFYQTYSTVMESIRKVTEEEKSFGAVAGDIKQVSML